MTSQQDFFTTVAGALSAAGIPFMVSGSLASSFHGEPRATNDLDLVIDPTPEGLARFLAALPRDWYVSADAARDAVRRRSMFNAIDVTGGWKVDLIVRKDRPYSREEFGRRATATVLGIAVPVVTPEDSILSKLEWSRAAGSDRQYRDALGVAAIRADTLDRGYLLRWAEDLGVSDLLTRLLAETDRAADGP